MDLAAAIDQGNATNVTTTIDQPLNQTELEMNIFERIRQIFRDFSFVEVEGELRNATAVTPVPKAPLGKRTLLERFIESIPTYSFLQQPATKKDA